MALLSFIEKIEIHLGPIHLKLRNKKDREAFGLLLMGVGIIGLFTFAGLFGPDNPLTYLFVGILAFGALLAGWDKRYRYQVR